MTVQSEVSRVSYSGDGSTTVFSVNFYFLADADLRVVVRASDGTETIQTLGTDYTVSGAGNENGGGVTFTTAPASGTTVVIVRNPPVTQLTDYNDQDPFPAASHERALDKLTMIVQRNVERLARAILLKETSSLSGLIFPKPEANQLLGWNSDADEIENKTAAGIDGEVLPAVALKMIRRNSANTAYEPVDANTTGLALLADETPADARDELDTAPYVADRTALKALDTTKDTVAILKESGREGVFIFDSSNLSTEVTADTQEGIYVPPDTDATGASGAWVRVFYGPPSVRWFGAVGDGVTDDAAAIQAAANVSNVLLFPMVAPRVNTIYRLKSTIAAPDMSRWIGAHPQSVKNSDNLIRIYGTRADIGDGTSLIKLSTTGNSSQSHVFQNLSFGGDLSVDFADLAATTDEGIVGVDVSGAKNGISFIDCGFRGLNECVAQLEPPPTTPFLEQVTFTRCSFDLSYRVFDGAPTAGLSLVQCRIFDCVDWIDCTTDVSLTDCEFNNSSFALELTGIEGRSIVVDGGWIEGGNNVFRPSRYLGISGLRASETMSASGSTKFIIRPQGDDVAIEYKGSRVPTNTRLISFSDVSDITTITMTVEGAYDGTNFSGTADIQTSITSGLNYRGRGNSNSDAWNFIGRARRSLSGSETLVFSDAGKLIRGDGSASTLTIPSNASVPYPIGTPIEIVNPSTTNSMTLAITSDTLLHSAGSGNRTLGPRAYAKLVKSSTTVWHLRGDGIT